MHELISHRMSNFGDRKNRLLGSTALIAAALVVGIALAPVTRAAGLSGNQTTIVTTLNDGASDPALAVLLGLGSLAETTAAINQLSPEIYLNNQTALLYSADGAADDLFSCQVTGDGLSVISEGNCVWLRPQGRYLDVNNTSSNIGLKERSGGVSVGAQSEILDRWYAGLSLGYERASLSTSTNASSTSNRYHAGAVLKYQNDAFLAAAGIIGGVSKFDSSRTHLLGTNNSSQDMYYVGAQIRAAYLMEQDNSYVKPLVDLNLTHINRGGFTETGVAATALTILSGSDSFFTISPAIEVGTEWTTDNDWVVRAFAKAGVTFQTNHSFTDHFTSHSSLFAAFTTAPAGTPNFTISNTLEEVSADLEAGFTVFSNNGTSVQIGYQARISKNSQQHGGFLKAAKQF